MLFLATARLKVPVEKLRAELCQCEAAIAVATLVVLAEGVVRSLPPNTSSRFTSEWHITRPNGVVVAALREPFQYQRGFRFGGENGAGERLSEGVVDFGQAEAGAGMRP